MDFVYTMLGLSFALEIIILLNAWNYKPGFHVVVGVPGEWEPTSDGEDGEPGDLTKIQTLLEEAYASDDVVATRHGVSVRNELMPPLRHAVVKYGTIFNVVVFSVSLAAIVAGKVLRLF